MDQEWERTEFSNFVAMHFAAVTMHHNLVIPVDFEEWPLTLKMDYEYRLVTDFLFFLWDQMPEHLQKTYDGLYSLYYSHFWSDVMRSPTRDITRLSDRQCSCVLEQVLAYHEKRGYGKSELSYIFGHRQEEELSTSYMGWMALLRKQRKMHLGDLMP